MGKDSRMCSLFRRQFSPIALSIALSLVSLIGFPARAEAMKALKAVVFDPGATAVNVAAIYETTPTTQKSTMKSLKSANKALKKAPGFAGSAMLQGDDGTRLIVLSQWQDLASYQAAIAIPPAQSSKETQEATAIASTRTVIFEISKAQTAREGLVPAVKGKQAVVEFSEFKLKAPEDQAKIIASAERLIPATLLKQPAPQSVVLLNSTDSTDVALMANWNCTADFAEGEKPTPFDALDAEVAALVDVDEHLYNVVGIVPAEVKKPKESEEA